MKSKKLKIIFPLYILVIIGLFVYSYTQIDLSLTFSRITILRNLVKSFQYIGYFNRPLSTTIFLILLLALTVFYIFFLNLANKKRISKKQIWTILISISILLAFSYNSFSYDLFNYIFDAKIITHYHQNPYFKTALDYPGDPMLSFMHWTHRTYPYGPVWLVLTVPLSFIGFNYFIPTFILFKMLVVFCFLGTLYYAGKILQKIKPDKELYGLVFLGLNPLMLIECLVSAHLDIVMIFFCLWSFYLLIQKKYLLSMVLLALSIGIKFATGLLIPVYLVVFILNKRKQKISWQTVFISSAILMIVAVISETLRTNFQPWYIILILSFVFFLADSFYVLIPSIIISIAAFLTYAPFLYTGNWNKPIPEMLNWLYISSYVLSFLAVGAYYLFKQKFILKNNSNPLSLAQKWKSI